MTVLRALLRRARGTDPVLAAYDAGRSTPHRPGICNAPFTNLYFSAAGKVGPCWNQLDDLGERWSPHHSIRDIWTGGPFSALREALADQRFPGPCGRCLHDIESGVAPLAAIYDREPEIIEWPTSLELELSNLCNFECVMCTGELSSKIRRNREHLPPLDVPYDDSFVDQVAELIPTLQQVRFSGGEPLLHPIMHKICDRIIELRPDLRIDVSTNGSTLNDRVRRLLERATVQINISFESLRPERYEAIRIGSDHARLLANIETFRELVKPNGGLVTINTNPMRETWSEMADIVRFCDERDLHLSFNTVIKPAEMSLQTLPADELEAIHATIAAERFDDEASSAAPWNHAQWANFLEQVRTWLDDARGRPVPVGVRARS
ncbi:MAG: radical SAM protein [Actinobacteria bacterium]|nr:radical SAM protein [Actinomycetota bacterium]